MEELQVLGEVLPAEEAPTDLSAPEDIVTTLVGEGRKYKDVQALAKSRLDADAYIKRLEEENAALRGTDDKIDAIMKTLTSGSAPTVATQPAPTPEASKGTDVDLRAEIDRVLGEKANAEKQAALQAAAKANIQKTSELLEQEFGNKTAKDNALRAFIQANPERAELINTTASKDPELAVAMIKSVVHKQEVKVGDPALGSSRGSIVAPGGGIIKWSDAKNVLLNDPKRYRSREFQQIVNASQVYFTGKGIDYYKQT